MQIANRPLRQWNELPRKAKYYTTYLAPMEFGQWRRRPFPLCRCGYKGIDYELGWWPKAMDVNARPTTFLIGIPRVIKDVIVEHVMARDLEECLRKCI
ncbi:MAG: hypothetical protein WAW52_02980 [Methanothrix sp.]